MRTYEDEDFARLFEVRGCPAAIAPWRRLALVTLMQSFAEGLSDRQAAETVRARTGRRYAPGLGLTDLKASTSACSRSSAPK